MSVSPISCILLLLFAAGAARAEGPPRELFPLWPSSSASPPRRQGCPAAGSSARPAHQGARRRGNFTRRLSQSALRRRVDLARVKPEDAASVPHKVPVGMDSPGLICHAHAAWLISERQGLSGRLAPLSLGGPCLGPSMVRSGAFPLRAHPCVRALIPLILWRLQSEPIESQ